MVKLCEQIRHRFDMNEDSLLAKLNVLDPQISKNPNFSPISIIPLAAHFPQLVPEENLNELDDQWRSYRLSSNQLLIEENVIPRYWSKIGEVQDSFQKAKFGILSDFMKNLTVLPHSSANVERIFSLMNAIKTKQTNSLKTETVKCKLLAKQFIKRKNNTCFTWQPTSKLLKEIRDGTVTQRYLSRLKNQRNLTKLESEEEDDDVEYNS